MRARPGVPPLVGQNVALLPDGSVDPAAATDCGEACVSSVVQSWRGLSLSPGCVRQSLLLPLGDGRTNGSQLAGFLEAVGLRARSRSISPDGSLQSALKRHLFRGQYVIVLGTWDSPSVLHWVLAYGWHRKGLWVMDPWPGAYRELAWGSVVGNAEGSFVRVSH